MSMYIDGNILGIYIMAYILVYGDKWGHLNMGIWPPNDEA